MNDNTYKLLEQLANKLGTTSQYLWGVLLKQAPISATIDIIQILVVVAFGVVLYKIHKRLIVKKNLDGYNETGYERYEIAAVLPMVIGMILFIILAVISLCSLGNIINGYLNPEYWALNEILSSAKK